MTQIENENLRPPKFIQIGDKSFINVDNILEVEMRVDYKGEQYLKIAKRHPEGPHDNAYVYREYIDTVISELKSLCKWRCE